MSTYCVTFRIADKTVGGKTYEDRRQSVIDAVYSSKGYWEETTSFILVTSGLGTEPFTKNASKGLSAADDLLVAFDPDDMSMAYFGKIAHPNELESFFMQTKKLP